MKIAAALIAPVDTQSQPAIFKSRAGKYERAAREA